MTTANRPQAELPANRNIEFVQKVLRADPIQRTDMLYETSTDPTLGTDPIPKERYYSRAFHDLEVKKMWSKVWQMVCWTADIPNAGDIVVYDLADTSVLVVRQRDGSIKAFHNACLHRGRQIMQKDGHAPTLYCPFHAFTWNLDGSLLRLPGEWDFPHVDKCKMGLPEVRVEEWNGFAFINLDPDAPTLTQYLEGLDEEWRQWDMTQRFKAAHIVKRMPANWKVVMDAFIEAYHAPVTHHHLANMGAAEASQYDVWPDRHHWSRAISITGVQSEQVASRITDQQMVDVYVKNYMQQVPVGSPEATVPPGGRARDVMLGLTARALGAQFNVDLSNLSGPEVLDGFWYSVFPNFMPWPTLSFPLIYRFRPDGNNPDASIMDIMVMAPFEGERPPSAQPVHLGPDDPMEPVIGPLGKILDQDCEQMDAVQRGLKALRAPGLTLSQYQESRIRHYHRTLMRYIDG